MGWDYEVRNLVKDANDRIIAVDLFDVAVQHRRLVGRHVS